jgi:hypothetical protein
MTDDIFLRTNFLNFMKAHRGIENAVPRDIVLTYLRQWEPELSDRQFRAFYSMLPEVCSCEHGLYTVANTNDIIEFEKYMRSKAIPFFDRVKRVREAHPQFAPGDEIQMGLF